MLKIHILETGSKGNCAVITHFDEEELRYDNETKIIHTNPKYLIVDCGVKNALEIYNRAGIKDIDNVEALLVTHEHKDHSECKLQMDLHGLNIIDTNCEANKVYDLGEFSVMPFEVQHDCKCYGYLIKSKSSNQTIVWMTDFVKAPIIRNADFYFIEANYDEDIIAEHLESQEDISKPYLNRLTKTHNSLQGVENYFSQMDFRFTCEGIILLHPNRSNINEEIAFEMITPFAKRVYLAKKDLILTIE